MAKPTSQERRKRVLKERRAELQRVVDREEAEFFFKDALHAYRSGEIPAADRLLKKALVLEPHHAGSFTLLAQIHEASGHFAEALGYLRQLQKLTTDPAVLYNLGVIYGQLKQPENATAAMQEFLAATKSRRGPKWQELRASATSFRSVYSTAPAPPSPVPAAAPPPAPKPPPPQPEARSEPPRAGVQFLPAPVPGFANPGSLSDYFLRRQWMELRLAQSFEDLLCLPSLHGVDSLRLPAGDRAQGAAALQRAGPAGR